MTGRRKGRSWPGAQVSISAQHGCYSLPYLLSIKHHLDEVFQGKGGSSKTTVSSPPHWLAPQPCPGSARPWCVLTKYIFFFKFWKGSTWYLLLPPVF